MLDLVFFKSSHELTADTLPVMLTPGCWRTVCRVTTCPVNPGDVAEVKARCGTLTSLSYTIGVAGGLFVKDLDGVNAYSQFGNSTGENITLTTHHLPTNIVDSYVFPSTWTPGHRATFALQVAAMSTAAGDETDVLIFDDYQYISAMIMRQA